MTSEYLIGRESMSSVDGCDSYSDALFEALRFDGKEIRGVTFKHCTFANNSFKNARLIECRFENVVFLSGYFRNCTISECDFSGCKFFDCDFSRVDFRSTRLKYYNRFYSTYIPFDRVRDCLPEEGNLRQHLCEALSRQALEVGKYQDVDSFRLEAIRGEKKFLRAVIFQVTPFYRQKFDSGDRFRAAIRLVGFHFFDLVWGARKSYRVVLRNWVVVSGLFGLWAATGWRAAPGVSLSKWDAAVFGFLSVFPVAPLKEYEFLGMAANLGIVAARLLSLIFSGLFIALLFSRIYEGRR